MSQAVIFAPEALSPPDSEIGKRCEVVNGQVVEKPPIGNFQVVVGSILDQELGGFARTHRLGRVVTEMLFKLDPTGKSKRRPDVAFVSYGRWAEERKIGVEDGWDVIPDLAIEVISPSNRADEVIGKVGQYFRAGALRVWVIYPTDRLISLYESPKKTIILGEGDDLDGGDILPGFRMSLAELFEDGE